MFTGKFWLMQRLVYVCRSTTAAEKCDGKFMNFGRANFCCSSSGPDCPVARRRPTCPTLLPRFLREREIHLESSLQFPGRLARLYLRLQVQFLYAPKRKRMCARSTGLLIKLLSESPRLPTCSPGSPRPGI